MAIFISISIFLSAENMGSNFFFAFQQRVGDGRRHRIRDVTQAQSPTIPNSHRDANSVEICLNVQVLICLSMLQELKLINVPDGLIFRDIVVRCSLLSPPLSFYKINKIQVTRIRTAAKYHYICCSFYTAFGTGWKLIFFTMTNGEERVRIDVLLSFGVNVPTRSYIEKVQ